MGMAYQSMLSAGASIWHSDNSAWDIYIPQAFGTAVTPGITFHIRVSVFQSQPHPQFQLPVNAHTIWKAGGDDSKTWVPSIHRGDLG